MLKVEDYSAVQLQSYSRLRAIPNDTCGAPDSAVTAMAHWDNASRFSPDRETFSESSAERTRAAHKARSQVPEKSAASQSLQSKGKAKEPAAKKPRKDAPPKDGAKKKANPFYGASDASPGPPAGRAEQPPNLHIQLHTEETRNGSSQPQPAAQD
uniref:Uncharacterized protein n=1 Tax=Sphaerodactylus townsendi TaxID=933632 RepID=A0ACB8GDT8_9SAUR